jgi:hypothetical protein
MAELRFPVRDKATKSVRDMLKRHGLKLVELRRYAVVRENDGAELCGAPLMMFSHGSPVRCGYVVNWPRNRCFDPTELSPMTVATAANIPAKSLI